MIAGKSTPTSLSPTELDDYLARGWYRIGASMITTEYLERDGKLTSTIWTRLDLTTHTFRKSLRKQMGKVARSFRVEVGPFVPNVAHEQVYAEYRQLVGGRRAETLDEVLGGEEGMRLFDTREVRVYDGPDLAAFSLFDMGKTSVQSIAGIYHPKYKKHGLGFYTMLAEIEHCAAVGVHFHYSGYIVTGSSFMDYKLRVGNLEYFDPESQAWLSVSPYPPGESPAEVLQTRLEEARDALAESGSFPVFALNSALQYPELRKAAPGCTMEPVLLYCQREDRPWGILVTYNRHEKKYDLFSGTALSLELESTAGNPVPIHLFLPRENLTPCKSTSEVAFWVRHYLAILGRG
ncbi:MAG: hypothetical protein IPK82_07735 [Polyangiaceae bacterium]|nr:hypothetical protein [Polyangiaceae bacterium]